MPRTGFVLSLLVAVLAAGSLEAEQALADRELVAALGQVQTLRLQLGLDGRHGFRVLGSMRDALGQAHVRFQQRFCGVPVWEGQVILHSNTQGEPLPVTDSLWRQIELSVEPALTPSEALALADAQLAPKGPYARVPVVERVVLPITVRVPALGRSGAGGDATGLVRQVQRYALAYHVRTRLENGSLETAHTDFLIDAQDGTPLRRWDTLHTNAAVGTGRSQYSGEVSLDTTATAKGFQLRDQTRGREGRFKNNVVTNLDHDSSGEGALFMDADNVWGDAGNYVGSKISTTGARGQTAAVDAAYGMQVSWDLLKHVFQRDGIDGTGKATYSRVHYGTSYDNAFWDDDCFCMTYGDGEKFTSLGALDVAGHEMSHGVCAHSAALGYSGESGGLNEASADIIGTLVEFYAGGGGFKAAAAALPETGGNWTIGEQLAAKPLRYMYKPSKDGTSPDAWSADLEGLDVHYSSGPMNRCFYFLSQGANGEEGDFSSEFLPMGMTGLGLDRAARIWYRALTVYLTASSDYAAARSGAIRAAKDLYGAGSAAEQAVWEAFHGINVGKAWAEKKDTGTEPGVQN